MPFTTVTGEVLDSGDYPALLQKCADLFDYEGERAAQLLSRKKNTHASDLTGIGIGFYTEPCGTGWESARVTLHTDGSVIVASGSSSQGQGHAVSFAVLAARELGCDVAQISVVEGDTSLCPAGIGALASRSMAIGGNAVIKAARLALEKRAEKNNTGGDTDNLYPIIAEAIYTAPHEAWSYGCVMVRLNIDRETGVPTIEKLVWVDDAGEVVSPELLRGQLLGGMAQGIGQAMMESVHYDDAGQLLTGSLMDYAVPRASDIVGDGKAILHSFHAANHAVNSINTAAEKPPRAAKGVGEAGCIGVPAAILNAACDALHDYDTDDLSFPLTSERLWRVMRQAKIVAK